MKNKKGFTLVEIIISIAIGSIVLMIAGSMLVSSFKFLFSTTDTDLDKRAVDSLIDVVRSDVEYSYDVRLVKADSDMAKELTTENGWHSYYVKDNVLYRDNEKLLDQSYYNKKNFELYANGNYENGVRVDFKYVLKNDDENAYSARDTIMFLNVTTDKKILDIGLYVGGEVPLTGKDDGYRLYFSDKYKTPSLPNNKENGTVVDQIELINLTNTRGEYYKNNYIEFKKGDFFYYDGYWYQWVDYDSNNGGYIDSATNDYAAPNNPIYNHRWKKIDSNWDENSAYLAGDIVIYNNVYYRCTSNLLLGKSETYIPGVHYDWSEANKLWERLDNYVPNEMNLVYTNLNDSEMQKRNNTIIKKLNGINLDTIPVYDGNNSHYDCEYNKYAKLEIGNSGVFEYYIKLFDNLGEPNKKKYNSQTGKYEVGWQKISIVYDENSAYVKDDIVYTGNYRSYIIATSNAGQIFQYNNSGQLVSINPENAGKINFYVPLSQCYSNQTTTYDKWWIYYNN